MQNHSFKESLTVLGTLKPVAIRSAMDGSMKLIILSIVMLLGSYLAGSIPLFIAMSEEKLQVGLF